MNDMTEDELFQCIARVLRAQPWWNFE